MSAESVTRRIKDKVFEQGFDLCGIAQSRILVESKEILHKWCDSGMNDILGYLSRNIEKRTDPSRLLPGTKSVIVTGLSYNTEKQQREGVPVISRYAYGSDYHTVIGKKLEAVLDFIKSLAPGASGRCMVDSAPLSEKSWAMEAGLGWQGRNAVIINRKLGSFFFIGVILTDIVLEYDKPFTRDYCGNCRRCMESCPTGAINDDRTIDARRCIANLTIENRRPVPVNLAPLMEGMVYGCDRCQEVCPWNAEAPRHSVAEFELPEELAGLTGEEWLSMSPERFDVLFRQSAIWRKGYGSFFDNIRRICNT
ncbi:MAG: tRNA epoxyqueuosine(34) reductase QueG [Bacteroidales bacterium]